MTRTYTQTRYRTRTYTPWSDIHRQGQWDKKLDVILSGEMRQGVSTPHWQHSLTNCVGPKRPHPLTLAERASSGGNIWKEAAQLSLGRLRRRAEVHSRILVRSWQDSRLTKPNILTMLRDPSQCVDWRGPQAAISGGDTWHGTKSMKQLRELGNLITATE